MEKENITKKIALLGNPNTGKSSVFNMLTGLRQHVGNFPGVTVDKKSGHFSLNSLNIELIDFPGTYSLYPHSNDESIVYDVLNDSKHEDFPDLALVVVDASNLKRNLYLFSQVYDLNIPCILVVNMLDLAKKNLIEIDFEALNKAFPNAKIVGSTARIGLGKDRLMDAISNSLHLKQSIEIKSTHCNIDDIDCQENESKERFEWIEELLKKIVTQKSNSYSKKQLKIDRILVHPFWGYFSFLAILLVIFQMVYFFPQYSMDWIDGGFSNLSLWLQSNLPVGLFTELLTEGIIPGIGGVLVFVPQIAVLFLMLTILEESGYLSRVVFLMDRLMRPLGLSGKSVVPLLSSVACAIPGVLATRTIPSAKDRLITILVAPLMSCSARIPVYTILIALVIPQQQVFGLFNLQGLVLFGLYMLGFLAAIIIAFILKFLINRQDKGFLLLELPTYKWPTLKNLGLNVWEKVSQFITGAGKIILAISIILWALASFGPKERMGNAEKKAKIEANALHLNKTETQNLINAKKIENSYMGIMGKTIEPIIKPLGYDWKIGIALITSFAAREVFVGSLATIYATKQDEKNVGLIERLKKEKNRDGTPVYTLATGLSLMVFYVFAMQCMATMAVVRKETKSWRWPLIQLAFMGILAYFSALFVYQIVS